jgi:hypothetical protein
MAAALRRLGAVAGLAVLAAFCAEVAGHRAFTRLIGRDVQALQARACPGRAGVVTEEMLTGLPEPVPALIWLRQKGRMRPGPGQRWMPLEAEEHYSVQPPGFVWAGTVRAGPVAVARARDMYAGGHGRMLVKLASLWPVADASGAQTDQAAMMRYLSEMIWFPAAFLAGNISFEAVDDSCARVTLTDHGRTATATLFVDTQGRLTNFVAKRYRTAGASDPETWSTPVTGYGEFEGLKLPTRGKAIYKLPGGDLDYIDVTITDLHYDTAPAPEHRARWRADTRSSS